MNKIIVLFLLCLTLCSCGYKPKPFIAELTVTLNNSDFSDTVALHFTISKTEGSSEGHTLFANSFSTDVYQKIRTTHTVMHRNEEIYLPIHVFPEYIFYNISDTTSITTYIYESIDNWELKRYFVNGNEKQVNTYTFTPTDSIFSLMQKDYSMLEKFPEYYQ